MDCPRCGALAVTTPECPACGVMLAKARAPRPRPDRSPPEGRHSAAWRSLVLPGLGFVLLIAAAVAHLRRPGVDTKAAPRSGAQTAVPTEAAPMTALDPGLAAALPDLPPPQFAPEASSASGPQAEADRATAERLAARLRAKARLTAEDVRAAEDLYARYPAAARDLLEAVLVASAVAERSARRFDAAAGLLERALTIAPQSPRPRRALLGLRLDVGDWAGAEQAGRALLALSPDDAEAVRAVAYALLRQDRVREATELLAAFLNVHADEETRAFLARIQSDHAPEKSLDEARLAHFHVRYDGDAHEEVGREILRLLDRHYATLARRFDHQPAQPIPVILLSRQEYHAATGAEAWSGGQYDSFDGRVRIPIGGLSAAETPELDETLAHELTHAFVADLSRGLAPNELHEGLAQHVEGRRMSQLDQERLRALADGRLRDVSGFYFGALWLVEDLVAQRGQGGINDLLRAMSATGSVDEAFRHVYGRDFAALQRQAQERLRQRHGS